ncbi:choice-of-anchor L domain-containing protein [Microbacterium enclense]|uniref:LPXTG-motif cell wall anchor domain-containing protein n=1 Tax=Microbacterium enclense TaxID=993073 RepID=A0A1G6GT95_9MICO|nr:choice-of-anchor L domain-containing protein [Microbacterium enclense]KSU55906.1 hypothetical protein AS029_02050 [Microbacterium enclense]SDB85103.1 hypothetical protein SAMN05216418_0652 [Microbacterium enclense]
MTPFVPTARRTPARRVPLAAAAAAASSAALILLAAAPAHAAATVATLEGQDAATAAESLIGEHVSLSSASLALGRAVQAGTFSDLDLGLPSGAVAGVALSTGSLRAADPAAAADVDFTASALTGPNTKLTTTGDLGGPGSALLETSFAVTTYDAAELRLAVIPEGDKLTIVYHIGSEEYAGWAERDYTDAFGVYVDGRLCSTLGDVPVGVATLNADTRSELYVSNLTADGAPGPRGTEMNGYSVALTCTADVTPGQPVEVVAAVADTVDGQLDSTLLLAANGISSVPGVPQPSPTPTEAEPTASAAPVPASVTGPAATGATRPGSPLAITGVDSAALLGGAGLAAAAVGAGAVALVVARRRRTAREVSEQ